MRHTQPLSAEESRVDAAITARTHSHRKADLGLTLYRMAAMSRPDLRTGTLDRVTTLMTGLDVQMPGGG